MAARSISRGMMGLGLVLSTLGFLPHNTKADLINLGTANAFNVFTLGDNTQGNTDAEGRVAVGGNANFSNSGYTVGSKLVGSTTNNLVVGGNYSNSNNTVNGNVVVGGSATVNNPTIKGNLTVAQNLTLTGYGSVNGNVLYGTGYTNPNTTINGMVSQGTAPFPVDFTSAQAYLIKLSNALASAAGTGTATFTGNSATNTMGQLTMIGSQTDANLFHIKGADLALSYGLSITAPSGSTVVIDVDGTADQMKNFGFTYNGIDRQHVLFNFSKASTLDLSGIGIQGSILAPTAAVNFSNGNIDGTLAVGSVTGGGESHNYQFQGNLGPIVGPNFGVVPEPSSVVMSLIGLGIAGGFARLRRQK